MKEEKIDFEICTGNTCFSRGNKTIQTVIDGFLKEHNLSDRVNIHSKQCFGECAYGPNIKVNGKLYSGIDKFKIRGILKDSFNI